jgi:hypothetical protein
MARGGAIYSTGPVIISYSILTNNLAQAGNGGNGGNAGGQIGNGGNAGNGGAAYGGALYSTGSSNVFYMTEFIYNDCFAGSGGAGGSFPSLTNYPSAEGDGGVAGLGGTSAGGAVFVTGSVYMTNCIFYDNIAEAGYTGPAQVNWDGGGEEGSPGGSAAGGALLISNGVANADIQNTIFFFNAAYGGNGGAAGLTNAIGGTGGEAIGGAVWSAATLTQMSFCTLATNYVIAGLGGTNLAGGGNGTAGTTNGSDVFRSAGVLNLSASILAGDVYSVPNAVGVTDAGYNLSSDASLTRSTTIPTTRLNVSGLHFEFGLYGTGSIVGGQSFGSYILTLDIPSGSPAESFVPGVPGVTFPATDEVGQPRSTPTSAGAFEANIAIIQHNADLPTILRTLPGTNLTGNGASVSFTNTVDQQAYTNPNLYGSQWQLNGTNVSDGANYSGTTSNILTVKKINASEEGNYTVIVSPTLLEGAVTSSVVALILTNSPVIVKQPVSQLSRPAGSIVTFTLNVGPYPQGYQYQWFFNGTSLPAGSEYSGTNSNILTINPANTNDAGSYSVIVSNGFNSIDYGAKTSAVVRLTIVPDHQRPTITITSPAANVRTNARVIQGTASDNAQVTNVMYWFTNINAGLFPVTNVTPGYATLTTNGSTNLNGPITMLWSITNMPSPGTNILVVQAVDYSSNVSTILTRRFFYQVQSQLSLTTNTSGGAGTLTGHAFIKGDIAPANFASLNIGEGYSIVAVPNSTSLLGNWTNISGTNVTITNGNTLHFVMEAGTSIHALFASNIFLASGIHGTYNGLFYVLPELVSNELVTNLVITPANGTNAATTNGVVSTNAIYANEVAFESAGMLNNLAVGKQGAFSGKLLLAGGSYTLTGSFNAFGHSSNSVARSAKLGGPLIVEMDTDTNGAGIITGTVSNAAWPTNASLWASLPATATGTTNYTLLMQSVTNAPTVGEIPGGDSYALIADHAGSVILSGGLADGTTFSQSVPASQANQVPVYVNLYGKTGFLFGWLNLTNLDAQELLWIKSTPAHPSVLFPNGFTNLLITAGSVWTNLAAITLSSSNTLAISNADLNLNYTVAIEGNDKLVNASNAPANSLTGTVNLKTGLLQITFGNGNGRATTRGYGAMLQNTTNAGGYFVIGANAGSITLNGSGSVGGLEFLSEIQAVGLLAEYQKTPSGPPLVPPLAELVGQDTGASPPNRGGPPPPPIP